MLSVSTPHNITTSTTIPQFDRIYSGKRDKIIIPTKGGPSDCTSRFIREMNRLAFSKGLRDSNFTNSHGLANKSNRSTCEDLGKLAYIALLNPIIRKIVNTKMYKG